MLVFFFPLKREVEVEREQNIVFAKRARVTLSFLPLPPPLPPFFLAAPRAGVRAFSPSSLSPAVKREREKSRQRVPLSISSIFFRGANAAAPARRGLRALPGRRARHRHPHDPLARVPRGMEALLRALPSHHNSGRLTRRAARRCPCRLRLREVHASRHRGEAGKGAGAQVHLVQGQRVPVLWVPGKL